MVIDVMINALEKKIYSMIYLELKKIRKDNKKIKLKIKNAFNVVAYAIKIIITYKFALNFALLIFSFKVE